LERNGSRASLGKPSPKEKRFAAEDARLSNFRHWLPNPLALMRAAP